MFHMQRATRDHYAN